MIMSNQPKSDSKAVTVSVQIYERLLAAYPGNFRREYRQEMKQLFLDQCRDAWNQRRSLGLVILWLRALPDWAKTAIVEHCAELNQSPACVRAVAFSFAWAVLCGVVAACFAPPLYVSAATISVNHPDPRPYEHASNPYDMVAQGKIAQSYRCLTNVVNRLHLDNKEAAEKRGKLFAIDDAFLSLVKTSSVQIHGDFLEVSVTNSDPVLAANIANAITRSYADFQQEQEEQTIARRMWSLTNASLPEQVFRLLESQVNNKTSAIKFVAPATPGACHIAHGKLAFFLKWSCRGAALALAVLICLHYLAGRPKPHPPLPC